MTALLRHAQRYLTDLLPGSVSAPGAWQLPALPYFLTDSFELGQLQVHGQQVVLATSRKATPQQTLHRMLARLQTLVGCRVLYAAPHLSTYERKRLLSGRVEFVVPGSQLFAPSLAIDLREVTTTSAPPSEVLALGPATQAMLLTLLFHGQGALPTLSIARTLGYSPMTASRANRELETAGLARVEKVGTKSTLALAGTPQEVWQRAKPLMRNPVVKELHASGPVDRLRLAGETALGELTLLVQPSISVYAINQNDWREVESQFTLFPEADTNTFKLQIWSYHTGLYDHTPTVDPLSLIVSLQHETDARVEISLEELESATWQRLKG